jgi:hypothetical protein
MVDLYYALYGMKEPATIKNPELAALYQPQKVEAYPSDEHEMKIELDDQLVDVKEIVPEATIEGDFKSIEIETEPMEPIKQEDDDLMIIETQDDDVVMKAEPEILEEKIFSEIIKSQPIDVVDMIGPSSSKRIKTDYGSDHSQSQPSIDASAFSGAVKDEIKTEHGSKVSCMLHFCFN